MQNNGICYSRQYCREVIDHRSIVNRPAWFYEKQILCYIDSIYLNYQKAFDSVSHVKLIEKLQAMNTDLKLIKLIAAFLHNRQMKVKVKLSFSDWVMVLSGVPQGSVLGFIYCFLFLLPIFLTGFDTV